MDRNDVVALFDQWLVDGDEVAGGWLRSGRQVAAGAQVFVEGVKVRHLAFSSQRSAIIDVETDLVDLVLGDKVARQVMS